jgi:hypothetical protein
MTARRPGEFNLRAATYFSAILHYDTANSIGADRPDFMHRR